MANALVAVVVLASLTWTVILLVTAAVGVPEMMPVDVASTIPAGSVPEVIDQVYAVLPPVAARV
jgi:hypothetical protein